MKSLFAIICFSGSLIAFDYSIVYVHIGTSLPNYLSDSIKQALLFNDKANIYLVANRIAIESYKFDIPDCIKNFNCESLQSSPCHKNFLKNSNLDTKFRDGFWRSSSERLFFLEELINKYDLKDVFHIENDVMLYVNLSQLLPIFHKYNGMAAIFDNDERCILSLLYIKNKESIAKLVDYCSLHAYKGLNDMQIVAKFKNVFKDAYIDSLPIIMPDYAKQYKLQNALGNKSKNPEKYSNNFLDFNSIFDAAAIGQYLGGTDPIHGFKKGFINESCIFNPSFLSYEWIFDNENRKVPFAIFKNKKYRINNLHIHSKDLAFFKS